MLSIGKELSVQEGTGPQPNLVNLNETDLYLEEHWQDLHRLDVYDTNNDQIGSVEDVYVDREQRQARLLDVSAGGMLGIGKKHFLVPVEEVKRAVNGKRLTVDHPKEKVMESPEFDPDEGGAQVGPSTRRLRLLRPFLPNVQVNSRRRRQLRVL